MKTLSKTTFIFILSNFFMINVNSQTKISNTKSFITYFKAIENMVSYKTDVKDSIERVGKRIKISDKISNSDKNVLSEYYKEVENKSDSLFDKIFNDFLNKETRATVVKDPENYVKIINVKFQDIKTADSVFMSKYSSISGTNRGPILGWIIKTFILPLAEEFINEFIDRKVRKLLNDKLRPAIVIKSWDSL